MFSPARALVNQRLAVAEAQSELMALARAVDRPGDLRPDQWAQLFATVLDFRPSLIIELGRATGNSTAAFTHAANRLGDCRVISLCLSDTWRRQTAPRIAGVVPPSWFDVLDAREGNILDEDPAEMVRDSGRVLLLWDAHGFDVADWVLGGLLPALAGREVLVLVHDISDTRYTPAPGDYGGHGVWRYGNDVGGGHDHSIRLLLGHLNTAVEQTLAIVDFTSRNGMPLHSADHSLHTELDGDHVRDLSETLGPLFSRTADWFYFSPNEAPGGWPAFFPRYTRSGGDFPHGALAPTPENIRRLQQRIREMEHSPFWRVRTLAARLLRRRS